MMWAFLYLFLQGLKTMSSNPMIGGQAVIEGVMMRAPKVMTIAVRRPDGEIIVRKDAVDLLSERFPLLKKPILRGVVALAQSMVLGIKALNFSAEQALPEEEKKKTGEMSSLLIGATLVGSFGLGIGLFFFLPLYLTKLLGGPFDIVDKSSIVFNAVDGVIRIVFFLAYIWGITFMKDIRRVFEYHGAEHKVIYAHEAGEELTVENVRKYSTLHPRCGTSFLLIVMLMAILVFSMIPQDWSFLYKALSRLVLLPIIAGLSYEAIKFSAKKKDSALVAAMIAPGLWLQKITTRPPSDDQLEVAIRAMQEALAGVIREEVPVP